MSSAVQPIDAVEGFVKLVESFASNDSFKRMQNIFEENTQLKERIREVEVANRENFLTAAQIQIELDKEIGKTKECQVRLKKVVEEKQVLEKTMVKLEKESAGQTKQLDSTAQETTRLQKELKKRESERDAAQKIADNAARLEKIANEKATEAELALARAIEQLNEREDKLLQLDSFKLQPSDMTLNDIAKHMNNLYERAYKLALNYCGDDLGQNVLLNASIWEELRLQKTINGLPMPVSNSPVARTMRIAAALMIISNILCEKIFRSDYVLKSSNELSDILDRLLDQDAVREQHVRAELVALCPEKQKDNATARMDSAAVDIFSTCRFLVPEGRRSDFRTALEKLCKYAATQWFQLQRVRQRIESNFKPEADDQWRMIPLLVDASTTPPQQTSAQKTETHKDKATPAKVTASQIQFVVWPGFLLIDKDEYDVGFIE
ncbi:hypothetical protein LQW54_000983 [Pestalotiopsis sp. IQ-011]